MLQLSYKSTVTNSQMPKIHLNEINEKIMMAITPGVAWLNLIGNPTDKISQTDLQHATYMGNCYIQEKQS